MTANCDHDMQPLSDEATGDIRRKTRTGRPNGAWLEGVNQCSKCGEYEARVSWYGQINSTPISMNEGNPTVQWNARQGQASGGGGMGTGQ
jgi:hypothetical protein